MNVVTLIVGIVALIAGYKLNQYANIQSEKRIIDALTAEIESLKAKAQQSRISSDEQAKITGLEEALRIVKTK